MYSVSQVTSLYRATLSAGCFVRIKNMQSQSYSVVAALFFLVCFVKFASSILCYDCNSAFDPRCGAEFDPFSLGVVNCSLRDPLEHIPPTEPTLCRSIKMEIYGKTRVVRQCGYIADETTVQSCRRQSGVGDLFVTYCSCDTDLCNAAPATHNIVGVVVAVMILVFRL